MLKRSRMSGQRWARVMRDGNRDGEGGTGGGGQSDDNGQNGGQQNGAQQGSQGNGQQGSDDRGFPDNTPVAEMTPEQQAAYWKHHSRQWESKAKAISQQELEELRRKAGKLDELEEANKTELEKANDRIAELGVQLAEYQTKEVRLQALTEAGLSLDLLEFITAADVETAKEQATRLKERIGASAPGNGAGSFQQGYQGRGTGKGSSVASGRELYQERRNKKRT